MECFYWPNWALKKLLRSMNFYSCAEPHIKSFKIYSVYFSVLHLSPIWLLCFRIQKNDTQKGTTGLHWSCFFGHHILIQHLLYNSKLRRSSVKQQSLFLCMTEIQNQLPLFPKLIFSQSFLCFSIWFPGSTSNWFKNIVIIWLRNSTSFLSETRRRKECSNDQSSVFYWSSCCWV